MTTPTASAAIPINPSDLYRNNSSRSSGHASTSASARGTGPVDLDETQNSIDSTTLDTNNQVAPASASAGRVERSSYEQSAQYQKVGQPKRTTATSSAGQRTSNLSASVGGVATSSDGVGGVAPGTSDDVNLFMQNLLEDMTKHFDQMGETILGRIEDMGSRIDEMEKNIGDLMNQAGLEPSVGTMPVASLPPQDTIGEQDAEDTASV